MGRRRTNHHFNHRQDFAFPLTVGYTFDVRQSMRPSDSGAAHPPRPSQGQFALCTSRKVFQGSFGSSRRDANFLRSGVEFDLLLILRICRAVAFFAATTHNGSALHVLSRNSPEASVDALPGCSWRVSEHTHSLLKRCAPCFNQGWLLPRDLLRPGTSGDSLWTGLIFQSHIRRRNLSPASTFAPSKSRL